MVTRMMMMGMVMRWGEMIKSHTKYMCVHTRLDIAHIHMRVHMYILPTVLYFPVISYPIGSSTDVG